MDAVQCILNIFVGYLLRYPIKLFLARKYIFDLIQKTIMFSLDCCIRNNKQEHQYPNLLNFLTQPLKNLDLFFQQSSGGKQKGSKDVSCPFLLFASKVILLDQVAITVFQLVSVKQEVVNLMGCSSNLLFQGEVGIYINIIYDTAPPY